MIAQTDRQPLVFHCAAGKDRTGLVAMLVLGLLGVDPDLIAADYGLTHDRMPVLLERHQARADRRGDRGGGRSSTTRWTRWRCERSSTHLISEYGSIEGYVLAHGLEPVAVEGIRTSLLD